MVFGAHPTGSAFSLGNISMGGIDDFMDSMSPIEKVHRMSVPDEVCQQLAGPSQLSESDSAKSTDFVSMIDLARRWFGGSFLRADVPRGPVPDPLGMTLYHFMKVSSL